MRLEINDLLIILRSKTKCDYKFFSKWYYEKVGPYRKCPKISKGYQQYSVSLLLTYLAF